MSGFVHLHVHSEYSLLDGACRIEQLVAKAKELGQTAIAVTDHGNMYATIEFYNEALKQGIKPIIGCEVYVAPRTRFDKVNKLDNKPYHLILLCENNEGYQNLIKLVSIGYTEGFYNKPRVDLEVLRKYHKGLIATSACLAGEVARNLVNGDYETAKETALSYRDIFGEGNYFIEIQNHHIPEQEQILPYLYKLSRETGIPLVAANDAHYINKEDLKMQAVLLAIQTNTTIDEPNGMGFPTDEFYLKSEEEMSKLFPNAPDAIANTVKIAERCNVAFEFGVIKLPKFTIEGITDNIAYFKELCYSGMRKLYGENPSKEITDRLEYELDVIISMGYVDYYLIVWDFVHYAKENGIPVGPGRGSGAGSIAAYCIGITGIDPMKYNLLFERFLNPERVSMPDFDIDFSDEGRQRVIAYVVRKYGSDRVAQIITFGTMAARGAIRDVGRAMGISYQIVDTVAKCIPMELNITIDKALSSNKELNQLYNDDEVVHELIDTARKVEGMPRHASTHAAGVVIASAPVSEFVPLQKNDESIVTQYEKNALESLGLLKMDFLGLRNLTVISDCVDLIRKTEPNFDVNKIPLDDKSVYEMLSQGKSQGVFQFESAGMRRVLTRLMPEALEDLIAANALFRPGPMDSIPTYIDNRHHPENVTYKTPLLKDILDVTYGCIVYQEQVMQICRTLAGYSYGRADLVRRAMAKKKAKVMEQERHSFIYGDKNEDGTVNCVGAVANGVPAEIANEIFDQMSSFASYAFNKSHAAAYTYLAYQTAYLKCYYYKEYMAALMTSVLDNTSKLIEYISDCEENNVRILNPDINESYEGFTAIKDGIRFGLLAVKNLGRGVIQSILLERKQNGKFVSLDDFCTRLYGKDVNKRSMESLIKCGALDCFKLNRKQMLQHYDKIFSRLGTQSRQNVEGQIDFFGMGNTETTSMVEEVPYVEEFTPTELLAIEKETVGMYISGHPLVGYQSYIRLNKIPVLSEIMENVEDNKPGFSDGDKVTAVVLVQARKLHNTKSNQQMAFVNFEDTTGSMEGLIFPKIYEENRALIREGEVVWITARISLKDDEEPKLIAETVQSAEQFLKVCSEKKLYLRVDSHNTERIEKCVEILRKYPGNTQALFFLSDLRKSVASKSVSGINLDELLLKELDKVISYENMALT